MNDAAKDGAVLEALEAAGLAEVYIDQDGHESMRLTEEGAAMAAELGILEHGPSSTELAHPGETNTTATPEPLDMSNSWGTAVGAAMLGFEQALRSEPPPEILAGEHVPERGQIGADDGVLIEFPAEVKRPHR